MRATKCAVCLDTVHFGRQASKCLGKSRACACSVTRMKKHQLPRIACQWRLNEWPSMKAEISWANILLQKTSDVEKKEILTKTGICALGLEATLMLFSSFYISFSLSFCQNAKWCVTQNAQLACQLLVDCQQNMPRISLKHSAGIKWILLVCSWRSQAAIYVLKGGWKCQGMMNVMVGAISGAETFGTVLCIILALMMW